MNISLSSELKNSVHEKVNSGFCTSASEVILMHTYDDMQKQKINQLNQAINVGLAQLKSGNKVSSSESYQRLKEKVENISRNKL